MKYLIIASVLACVALSGINCEDSVNYTNLTPNTNPFLSVLNSPRAWTCNDRCCKPLCRMAGFGGGVCIDGKCNCDPVPAAKECHAKCCQELCTHENFFLGKCEAQECMCYQGQCTDPVCASHCASINSDTGTCRNNRCECSGAMSLFTSVNNLVFLLIASAVLAYQKL